MPDLLIAALGFLITFASEAAVVYAFLKPNFRQLIIYELLINLFTWPLANLLSGSTMAVILAAECAVVLVECVLIKLLFDVGSRKAMLVSFAANAISFLLGIIIFQILI